MKLKITIIVALILSLAGCASVHKLKKPPRCDGKRTRPLNIGKWNLNNQDIIFQEGATKPVVAPVILNMLESEKKQNNVTWSTTPSKVENFEQLYHKNAEVARE
ncbi:hypothetical protein [Bartonella ancashensis]|uniref:Lipoprotein of type IV secretion complex that spans outer membrane and periplasm, VirB7 n=1 Tax=Bartonella ancashensis TaxID=1318743 RepID=A0A0M4LHJ7_9HYPH|nr:hypothetical protein [Bartonella ancashensis]ALE03006.1 Lipoprotein of type IV secretion complex that spans outer membrane and periplasm, VirB7 [Bartonella ancashensis]